MDGNVSTTGPFVKLPTPAQKAALEARGRRPRRDARSELERLAATLDYADPADASSRPARGS